MSTNYIIGIVVVIIILGGGFFYFQSNESADVEDGDDAAEMSDGTHDDDDDHVDGDTHDDDAMMDDGSMKDDGAAMEDKGGATVTYSDSGFSPSSVTVAVGESVTFVNASSRSFWPASAIHPTHSVYPVTSSSDCLGSSFDACEGLSPGASWSYTFTEAGDWGYHDHLRANNRGTVVVQ